MKNHHLYTTAFPIKKGGTLDRLFNLIKLSKYALLHDLPFQLASHWHFPLFSITKFCNLWLQALKLLKQFFYFTALEISLLRTVRRKTFVLCWTNWSPTVSWHQASTHFWHWTVKSHLERCDDSCSIKISSLDQSGIKTVSYIINESFLDCIFALRHCFLQIKKPQAFLFSWYMETINHGICHGHLNLKLLLPKIVANVGWAWNQISVVKMS